MKPERLKSTIRSNKLVLLVLVLWLVVNLFQAAFTGLLNDEAYYWFYAQHPAWGYYDHPPMVAWVIWLGMQFLDGALGVRFLVILFSLAVIWWLRELTSPRNERLFFLFVFSVFIFQADGFITVPDTVFVFFVALYFYALHWVLPNKQGSFLNDEPKKGCRLLQRLKIAFIGKETPFWPVFWLLMAVVGMIYSKYFAFPVLLFTILAVPDIVKKRFFWTLFLLSFLAVIPHFLWQKNHDFITFYFHLKERNVNAEIGLNNVFSFLGGQLLLMNPLIAYFIIKGFWKKRQQTDFDRVLRYNVLGIFGIAFVISFFKRVEANWTIAAYYPMLVLVYPAFEKYCKRKKLFYRMAGISLALILFLRLSLMVGWMYDSVQGVLTQFYGWEERSKAICSLSGDQPVVFSCSYQNASQYRFHTGKESFTFNNLFYRKNQYDLEGIEPALQGKEVLFLKDTKVLDEHFKTPFVMPDADSVFLINQWWYYKKIPHYYSYNFLTVQFDLPTADLQASSRFNLPVTVINPLDSAIVISPGVDSWITVCFAVKNRPYTFYKTKKISGLQLNKIYKTEIPIQVPSEPGKYFLWISIQTGWLSPAINHRVKSVKVIG